VCEHIPYLILSVRQLMHELFDSHRMRLHPILCRSDTSVSRWASRRAHLEPPAEATYMRAVGQAAGPTSNHPLKRHKRVVGQDAGPASNHPPKRYMRELSGKVPGPSQSQRSAKAPRVIRRASRCRGATCDPALKPQPAGAADIEPNPLDYSL